MKQFFALMLLLKRPIKLLRERERERERERVGYRGSDTQTDSYSQTNSQKELLVSDTTWSTLRR